MWGNIWYGSIQIFNRTGRNFPHPTPFFGFNTSCFWRWNVLYLYRDMGGASAPPFFRHFPVKIGDLEAHPGKICLPQILIRGRQRKTMCRVGKIGRRKVFSKVKNVNVESLKNGSKLLDFLGAEAYPNPSLKGRAFQTSTWGSPLMPINFPINSVQFVNNSCSKKQLMAY